MTTCFFSPYSSLLISFYASTPAWQSRRLPLWYLFSLYQPSSSSQHLPRPFCVPSSLDAENSLYSIFRTTLSTPTCQTPSIAIFVRSFVLYVSYSSLASLRFVDILHYLHIRYLSHLTFFALILSFPLVPLALRISSNLFDLYLTGLDKVFLQVLVTHSATIFLWNGDFVPII